MSENDVRAIAREMDALLHGPGKVGRQDRLKQLSRALLKALKTEPPVPTVRARRSASGNRLIVDCPYCHGTHYHEVTGLVNRKAGCLRGEYILEVNSET